MHYWLFGELLFKIHSLTYYLFCNFLNYFWLPFLKYPVSFSQSIFTTSKLHAVPVRFLKKQSLSGSFYTHTLYEKYLSLRLVCRKKQYHIHARSHLYPVENNDSSCISFRSNTHLCTIKSLCDERFSAQTLDRAISWVSFTSFPKSIIKRKQTIVCSHLAQ